MARREHPAPEIGAHVYLPSSLHYGDRRGRPDPDFRPEVNEP